MAATYVEGDHGTVIRLRIKDSKGVKINITGGTVILRWTQGAAAEERTMTIVDGPNGVAEYVIDDEDFAAETPVSFETEYSTAGGAQRYTAPLLNGPYTVRKNLEEAPLGLSAKYTPMSKRQ